MKLISEAGFVSEALRNGFTCSCEELAQLEQFSNRNKLDLLGLFDAFLSEHEIEVEPPLVGSNAEWTDSRVFRKKTKQSDYLDFFHDALTSGEGHFSEYKQTFLMNVKRFENDPGAKKEDLADARMCHEVVKTICAFLNADGGTLLIGVCDSGDIYGIENDFPCIKKGNTRDHWELYFRDHLADKIPEYRIVKSFIRAGFITDNSQTVCVVRVLPRKDLLTICYPHTGKDQELVFLREGNQSLLLKTKEIEALVITRVRNRR